MCQQLHAPLQLLKCAVFMCTRFRERSDYQQVYRYECRNVLLQLDGVTCTNFINNYVCTCATGSKGCNCEQINDCTLNPCQWLSMQLSVRFYRKTLWNRLSWVQPLHAACRKLMVDYIATEWSAGGGYEWFCVHVWTGENCDESVDTCAEQPCRNVGTCTEWFS